MAHATDPCRRRGLTLAVADTELGKPYDERQDMLRQKWGFECTCDLCSMSQSRIAESDARRTKMTTIRRDVLDIVRRGEFRRAIKANKELLALAHEEELVDYLGDTYEILARLYNAVQDRANAEKYARLALEDLKVFGGPDRYDSVQRWQDFL